MVDAVKAALMFARLVSIDELNDWALAIDKLERLMRRGGKANASYEKYAVREDAYKSREARFIIYGHTHQFAVTPLRTTSKISDGWAPDVRHSARSKAGQVALLLLKISIFINNNWTSFGVVIT